ncbi:MAG: hypothetical protein LBU43_06590 [Candidatus Accumulibacter sp.]|jgi:hypothetical protein|nr:hypothetical protein [Accumulibacter sp.]
MKSLKSLSTLAVVAALAAPGAAFAASAEVTFKNINTSQSATYSYTNSGEAVTYANAEPKPLTPVPSGGTNIYTVGPITSLVTGVHVRYTIGSKTCVFHSSFTGTPSGNNIIPNWTKSADSSGGATCTANITYTDSAQPFNWKVTFTIK